MIVEVIIAVYNKADVTRATLDGYLRQTYTNFSVAIADDGSDSSIQNLVGEYRGKLDIRHVWHEDKGYRRALILNKCIATSTADYIIIVDNDCIPHRHFVSDHAKRSARGYCITGRRVNLGPNISSNILQDFTYIKHLENPATLLALVIQHKVSDGGRGFHLPDAFSNIFSRKKRGLLGSNMAAWRKDLLDVNGFDSSFTGYGYEETDLEWRLCANGIQIRSLVNQAIQFHFYHERQSPTNSNLNQMNANRKNKIIFASHGIREAEQDLRNTVIR